MLTNFEINKIAEVLAKKVGHKDELLTIKQAAEWLGVTEHTLRSRCSRGTIPHHRTHGNLYFSKDEVTEYYLKGDNQ